MISVDIITFEIQTFGWDLSLTRIGYKLTKRTTKIENFEKKYLKMYSNINLKTIRNRVIASSNNLHLIVTYKFMTRVSILRAPKKRQISKFKKK